MEITVVRRSRRCKTHALDLDSSYDKYRAFCSVVKERSDRTEEFLLLSDLLSPTTNK